MGRWVGGGVVATGGDVLGLQSKRWYLRKIPTDGGSCVCDVKISLTHTGHLAKNQRRIQNLLVTQTSNFECCLHNNPPN